MAELLKNTTTEKVMLKNRNKEEVVKGVFDEVKEVSSVTYDLTLVCKGGATVGGYRPHICHFFSTEIFSTQIFLHTSCAIKKCYYGFLREKLFDCRPLY